MNQTRRKVSFETILGAVVLGIALSFLVYTSFKTDLLISFSGKGGLSMYAEFESVDGLRVGSPVLLAGVKVGSVAEISLDTKTYFAKTRLELDRSILIPEDSEAIIVSDGLLGEKYVSVNVGGADNFLNNGDQFLYTQGSVNIINLLNQFSAR